ncbi:MAG: S24/S26 family peptidase [Clostridiales Family XIII bacterium]|jgi:hypothetical protein|nr:S24/S26 family peptidase [Clostridiales Family XIII bacterium]
MQTKNIALKARIESAGQMTLPLRGRCMEPLLTAGDQVKIIPVTHFSKGCLYLFELPDGGVAVHRLIDKTGDRAVMKGDRSRCFETTLFQNIIGEASAVKLLNSEHWHDIRKHKLAMIIILHISKKLAAAFSFLTRKRWGRK